MNASTFYNEGVFHSRLPDTFFFVFNLKFTKFLSIILLQRSKEYYLPLVVLICFIIPTLLPTLWGETLWNAFFICAAFRYVWTLNMTWLVNSAAHFWGRHPYDNTIKPAENLFTVYGAVGEGFHNYHHVFPWDYRASELGFRFNLTTIFIDLMAALGQAYDLKQVSTEMVISRKHRTGDIYQYGNYGRYNPIHSKTS
ncbi:hypothetical protein QR98_0032750 [Sarcoptes scabiei]|uniref:Uncharacterized protein n=1 Tax=Sarcoptes scabiei TaxID=52283 RepID=A0A132A1M0_SARSC|nr:hypothetical protein QR98_0032750 [Sarcoptes scabiei]